jgi:hypothetical protein
MSIQSFSPKDPEEVIVLTVKFDNLLGGAETITGTPVFTAERQDGTTEDTSAMISGTATVQGGSALQLIAGGTNGATYLIRAKVTTSAGRTLVGGGLLPIKRGAA